MVGHVDDHRILRLIALDNSIDDGVIIGCGIVIVSQALQLCPVQVGTVVVSGDKLLSLLGETGDIIHMLAHEVVDGKVPVSSPFLRGGELQQPLVISVQAVIALVKHTGTQLRVV